MICLLLWGPVSLAICVLLDWLCGERQDTNALAGVFVGLYLAGAVNGLIRQRWPNCRWAYL